MGLCLSFLRILLERAGIVRRRVHGVAFVGRREQERHRYTTGWYATSNNGTARITMGERSTSASTSSCWT